MWNPGAGSPPLDFLTALYGEDSDDEGPVADYLLGGDSGDEVEVDKNEKYLSDEEINPASGFFITNPFPALFLITRHPSPELRGVVLDIPRYNEDNTPLDDFLTPDLHALFESTERLTLECESSVEKGNSRGRSLRGRVRGGRGGSVRNRGQLELREMVRDVLRRRKARLEGIEARRRVRVNEELLNEEHNSESENHVVFEDAIDGRGSSLLEGVDLHFEWSPMETFQNVEESFVPERTGSVASYSNPCDAFRSFWDDSILQVIVDETNRYASRIQSANFHAGWHPTNVHELLCLFAFWMMTGIIRMPTNCSYFSSNALLKTEIFSRFTTLRRYTNLNRALHFVDTRLTDFANPTNSDAASSDPLPRLKPIIIDHLKSKFQANYVMSKDICVDESLTLGKGRLKFKQYIRSKAIKFGIKTLELCESATGYLWSFVVYTGK